MRKTNKNLQEIIPGQLTLWDLEITQKPEKITEKPIPFTNSAEKSSKTLKSFTEQLEKVIEKFKGRSSLNRIIHYYSGGLGIELEDGNSYTTHYFNTEGKEEYVKEKQLPVLPMDRIVYYKTASVEFNNMQEEKLKKVLQQYPLGKVIKRNGDYNIHIELADKVIYINPIGWVLEFNQCKIAYAEDEMEKTEPIEILDIKEIQSMAKLGDIIEAEYGEQLIQGKVIYVYNNDFTLNILFANGTKHTAVPRVAVTKILKSA